MSSSPTPVRVHRIPPKRLQTRRLYICKWKGCEQVACNVMWHILKEHFPRTRTGGRPSPSPSPSPSLPSAGHGTDGGVNGALSNGALSSNRPRPTVTEGREHYCFWGDACPQSHQRFADKFELLAHLHGHLKTLRPLEFIATKMLSNANANNAGSSSSSASAHGAADLPPAKMEDAPVAVPMEVTAADSSAASKPAAGEATSAVDALLTAAAVVGTTSSSSSSSSSAEAAALDSNHGTASPTSLDTLLAAAATLASSASAADPTASSASTGPLAKVILIHPRTEPAYSTLQTVRYEDANYVLDDATPAVGNCVWAYSPFQGIAYWPAKILDPHHYASLGISMANATIGSFLLYVYGVAKYQWLTEDYLLPLEEHWRANVAPSATSEVFRQSLLQAFAGSNKPFFFGRIIGSRKVTTPVVAANNAGNVDTVTRELSSSSSSSMQQDDELAGISAFDIPLHALHAVRREYLVQWKHTRFASWEPSYLLPREWIESYEQDFPEEFRSRTSLKQQQRRHALHLQPVAAAKFLEASAKASD